MTDDPDGVDTVRRTHTVTQVADFFGVHRQTVYGWIERGDIPYRRVGGLYRLSIEELDAHFQSQQDAGP